MQTTCPCCQHAIIVNLSSAASPTTQLSMTPPTHPSLDTTQTPDSSDYSLRREPVCWVLVFKNGNAFLKYEIGLAYVARLLSQPGEPVPSATLFSECSTGRRKGSSAMELADPDTGVPTPITDGVSISQWPPDNDEDELRRRCYAELKNYRKTIANPNTPGSKRAEAQRLHDELNTFLKKRYRRAPDPGREVTRLVHRSIQRLCDHLGTPMPGEKTPSPVAVAFAEYVVQHILVPSRRYTRAKRGARVRFARGELAGRLVFECPPGHRWSVHP
jgi:hypothetical protein